VIGIDTNVLVRYLTQDDAIQSPIATKLIEGFSHESPGFISQVVLVETVWVLSRAYKIKRAAIADILETILRARELVVEQAAAGLLALTTYRETKAGFADALLAQSGLLSGCHETLTFDKAAARATGMQLLA